MGKYAATRTVQRSNLRSIGNDIFGPINSGSSYGIQAFLYHSDPTGLYRGYIASRDSYRYMLDYINNRGLQWSDIRYPSLTRGFSSDGGFSNSLMSSVASIAKLYL